MNNYIKQCSILYVVFLFLLSCKKDSPTVISTQNGNSSGVQQSIFPLTVGNYWIYQKSNDDSLGNLNFQNEFDSVYIEKDTFILGQQYYKFCHTNANLFNYYGFRGMLKHQFIKDSAGIYKTIEYMLVMDNVHVGDTVFQEKISPTWRMFYIPENYTDKSFTLGSYSGKMLSCIQVMNGKKDTVCSWYHTPNIGLVKNVYSYPSCVKMCRYSNNLIRYHIN